MKMGRETKWMKERKKKWKIAMQKIEIMMRKKKKRMRKMIKWWMILMLPMKW